MLLIKPGGPFWRKKDVGAWMIPKGMVEQGETPLEAALREFEEEVGVELNEMPLPLCDVRQAGGKIVEAFALKAISTRRRSEASISRWNGRPKRGLAKLSGGFGRPLDGAKRGTPTDAAKPASDARCA